MKKISLIAFVLVALNSFGQGENNIWHFGYGAGLDFNSGAPVSINGGQTLQREGVAAVSDATGNLLFYTDGITVWQRNHLVMPNGNFLLGDPSSTQSATIIPVTGNPNQYYLFTCPAISSFGDMYYSIVDMSLNGGFGDVTATKNISLLDSVTEQCAVIPSTNGCVWLVARQFNPLFYAWMIDAGGIHPPVISNCGVFYDFANGSGVGYMKASSLNNKIAIANYGTTGVSSNFELYDFDNATGTVSNMALLAPLALSTIYACEFSPDGTKFYGADWGANIYQFDLTAGNTAAIQASEITIGTVGGSVGDIQIGPDQKIYLTVEGALSLSVINNPNALGVACNFNQGTINLGGNSCGIGLPGHVFPSLCTTLPSAAFIAPNHICPGTCTNFINHSTNATTYQWAFPGATPSVSTDVDPQNICYNTPGQYSVMLVATNVNGSDTLMLSNFITVYPYPAPQGISQSGDTLFAMAGAVSYQWYHNGIVIQGATNYYYVAQESGDYNIVATDINGCEVEAAIFDVVATITFEAVDLKVDVYPNPVIDKLIVGRNSRNIGTINKILIYDMPGKIIMVPGPISQLPFGLDVHSLSKGVYMIELSSGDKTLRSRFVKQ
ncbi:MAG: T9SS type A sorting domain-containing protein [Bacteroidota bacterium]